MPMGATPFPFGDCRVCTDKATGVHYGVATCEGCKGFFKRSIPKASRYQCFFGGQCVVNPQNRNRCKACRFQRCVSVGMSVDAVKMGRIPKVDKERALAAHRHDDKPPAPSEEAQPFNIPPQSFPLPPHNFSPHLRPHDPLDSRLHKPLSPVSMTPFDTTDKFLCGNGDCSENLRENSAPVWSCGDTPPQQVPRQGPAQWHGGHQGNIEHLMSSPSSSSSSSSSPSAVSPFSPTVIKELINQVIESGQGKELQQTLLRQFFKDEAPSNLKRKLPPEEDLQGPAYKQPFKQEMPSSDLQDDFLFDLINSPIREPGSNPSQQIQDMTQLQDQQLPHIPDQQPQEGFIHQLQLDLLDLDQYLGPHTNEVHYLQRNFQLNLDGQKAELLSTRLLGAATSFLETIGRNKMLMHEELSGVREPHPMNLITHPRKHQVLFMWGQLMDAIPMSNFDVLGLCRATPMFNDLDAKDQALLMDEAYFHIWMTLNSVLLCKGDSFMRLPCDARYSRLWMRHFLPQKVVSELFFYAERLNSCHLTQVEIITLCVIQLTNPDHSGLLGVAQVHQMHQIYLSLLWTQLKQSHASSHSEVYEFLMQLIPILTPLNKMQADIVSKFQVDCPPEGVLKYTEDEDDDETFKDFN